MDLIASTYYNIWPFQDRLISINFKSWKYLIKAPIWTGKSFLFFDWVIFWLYKYSTRNMLNRKSKEGFLKLLFYSSWDYYLIERSLKPTKIGGESVNSRLYKVLFKDWYNIDDKLPELMNYDVDIWDIIKEDLMFEEIIFKSWTELQNHIEDLMLPREVFTTTNFLLQDSDNIFEMLPSERINVFKNIFWLISIDHARDIISENRKEIQFKLKTMSDSSGFDTKLRDNIVKILDKKSVIQILLHNIKSELIVSSINKFLENKIFDDFDMVKELVNIQWFDLKWVELDEIKLIYKYIETYKWEYQWLLWKYQSIEKFIEDLKFRIKSLINDKNQLNLDMEWFEQKIKLINEEDLLSFKKQKQELVVWQDRILWSLDFITLRQKGFDVSDIHGLNLFLESKIAEWKSLRMEIENIDLKIQNISTKFDELSKKLSQYDIKEWTDSYIQYNKEIKIISEWYDTEIKNIDFQIDVLVSKKSDYDKQIDSINKRFKQIWKDLELETKFHCDMIAWYCPYITQIKWDSLRMIKEQQDSIQNEKMELEDDYKKNDIEGQIKKLNNKRKEIMDQKYQFSIDPNDRLKEFMKSVNDNRKLLQEQIDNLDHKKVVNDLMGRKNEIENQINEIKELMVLIDWREFKEKYKKYVGIESKIREIDKLITNLETEVVNIEEYKGKIISIKSKIEATDTQISESESNVDIKKNEVLKLDQDIQQFDIGSLDKLNDWLKELDRCLWSIKLLIDEYSSSQVEIKKLQEEEKMLDNMYIIFSKELMLVVLQEFLPSLADVINNLLAQVVDYELSFDLIKKSSDKLELDIQISDDKWIRSVKSLSWWQKVILKLVWILAVSSMVRAKFLFLDETINNLDFDTVWRVSELLEDFIKTHDIKFFVVTHSQQIQDMDIRSWVVTL